MTEKIIDISTDPARLSVRHSQLVIERNDAQPVTVPLEELAVLVISHPAVLLSQPVMSGLCANGGVLIVCDAHRLPIGMMLPLQGHHLQSERFAQQADASLPVRKRAWQDLVQAKIRAQGRLLADLYGDDSGLRAMAERVRSGDADNLEGLASRRYWPALFANPAFRRNREGDDQNRLLNYGYAVLRAIVARAICAAGLHPSLGLHHHNRYDAFPLADDLMEPFRPVVDRAVVRFVAEHDGDTDLTPQAKAALISALMGRFDVQGEARTLFDAATRLVVSLAAMFAGDAKQLTIPDL